jgi:hypothetical protein
MPVKIMGNLLAIVIIPKTNLEAKSVETVVVG